MVVIFFNSNPCKTTCLLFLLCIVEYSQYRFFVVVVVVYCAIFTVSKCFLSKIVPSPLGLETPEDHRFRLLVLVNYQYL